MIEIEQLAIEIIKTDCINDMYNGFNARSQNDVVSANNGFMLFAESVVNENLIPEHLLDFLQLAINEVYQTALSLLKSL